MRFAAVDEVEGDEALLTAVERARRDRLVRAEDRAAYVAAHLLARACVAQLLGIAPAEVELRQRCARCGSDQHGAPYVPGVLLPLHVSLSHTEGYVAAVASQVRCGIDVEAVRSEPPPWGALSGPEEAWVASQADPGRAFTRLWVRKEALVKAGVGSLEKAAALDVLADGRPADRAAGLVLQEWSAAGAVGVCAFGAH
ncbi:4'-phosphopantetheinyl transferase superfamily protein [Nocardioides sp. DS6]|uniref:4'-phosphopantetheinyl transferase superfamily protein n=1 Tax=Nocardioides eburneus TaxID=3231482 RepID=A0ABV3SUN7_9ACTN